MSALKKTSICLLGFLLILNACKKDSATPESKSVSTPPSGPTSTPPPVIPIDTVFPGSYFPIYPGSHWTYSINNAGSLSTVTESVNPAYVKSTYCLGGIGGYSNFAWSDTAYVPVYDGTPYYKYSFIQDGYSSGTQQLWPKLSEHVGSAFYKFIAPHYLPQEDVENISVNNKYLDGTGDSVLLLKGIWTVNSVSYGANTNHVSWYYYKKNIGMTAYYTIDISTSDTIYRKELTGYFVNH